MQIERLVIWSKDAPPKLREVEFRQNCVNVVSGNSRTGKSAICAIIDYCLGSHDCSIPGGKVRENASWYGAVFVTDEGRLLLARRNPEGDAKSSGDCVMRKLEEGEPVPPQIEGEALTDRSLLVEALSRLAGLEPIRRDDSGGSENDRISFRDICHLLFQPQDVVASRLQMFDKMNVFNSKFKLANWFNFVIGVETEQDILDKIALEAIRRELEAIERERARDAQVLGEWIGQLRGELVKARNYNLVADDEEIPPVDDREALLALARATVDAKRTPSKPPKSEYAIKKEIRGLEEAYNKACQEASRAEKRSGEAEELVKTIVEVGEANARKKDRLQISKWISANWKPSKRCPVCGGEGHPFAKEEVSKICRAVEELERVAENIVAFPASSRATCEQLKKAADAAKAKKDNLYDQLSAAREQKIAYGDFVAEEKEKSRILEGLERTLKLNETRVGGSRLDEREKELKAERAKINQRYSQGRIKEMALAAHSRICDLTQGYFNAMDTEESYQKFPPVFEEKDLTISLRDLKNQRYSLHEVGSASNWVAAHVSLTCALHEYSADLPRTCIPEFEIYDQPSQVYFPAVKLKRDDAEGPAKNDDPLEPVDVENVRKIFSVIARSCTKTDKNWQAIVLDHAGPDVYGQIDGVNIVEEWRDGKALIPRDWYEEGKAEK